MKPILLQYTSPASLVSKSNFYGGLIVTAQQQMAVAFRRHGFRAIDINSFLQALLPQWYSPLRMMRQRLLLRRLIEECALDQPEVVRNAFLNNTSDVLKSIRTLIEIGATVQGLPTVTVEQKVFQSIYLRFIQSRESGVYTLQEGFQKWHDSSQFVESLNHCRLKKDPVEFLGWPARLDSSKA